MRAWKVRLFELAAGATVPVEVPGFAVDAEDPTGAMKACQARLWAWGHKVRSLSWLAPGAGADLAAVVIPAKLPGKG